MVIWLLYHMGKPTNNDTPTKLNANIRQCCNTTILLSDIKYIWAQQGRIGGRFSVRDSNPPPPHHPKGRFGTILRYKNLPKFLVIGLFALLFFKKIADRENSPLGKSSLVNQGRLSCKILQDSCKRGLSCKILQDGGYLARSCKMEVILQES